MSELKSLRADTAGLLAEERRRADAEINKIRAEYQGKIRELENDQREQIEEQNRALAELEKKHIRSVQAAEARIEAGLKEEEACIQRRIDEIRREANEKILAQKRLFEQKLREMYEVIDRRVKEVMAKMEAMERDEQKLARESFDKAFAEYDEMIKDPNVRDFQADTVKAILEPMMLSCQEAYNRGNWAAATGKALLIEVECKRTKNDARNESREWQTRLAAVRDRLNGLQAGLSEMVDEAMVVSAVGLENEGSLESWDKEAYKTLFGSIKTIQDALEAIPPGQFADLTNLEMGIIRIENGRLIEDAIEYIVLQITAHLMSIKMLAGICSAESEEWELDEDSEVVEKEHCSIRLGNRQEEILKADVYVDTNSLKRGAIRLILKMSMKGTKNDAILAANLREIGGELKDLFLNVDYGYLTMLEHYEYQDEEGYPGQGMEFRPELRIGDRSRGPSGTAERTAPASGEEIQTTGISKEKGKTKGETV